MGICNYDCLNCHYSDCINQNPKPVAVARILGVHDGVSKRVRKYDAQKAKAYYQAHKADRIAYQKRYYRKNREERLRYQHEYLMRIGADSIT